MPSPPKLKRLSPFESAFRTPPPTYRAENPGVEVPPLRRPRSAAFKTNEDLSYMGTSSLLEHSDDDCSTRAIRFSVHSEGATIPIDDRRRAFITSALCLTSFLTGLELALTSTILPAIEDDISVSTTQYSWIGAAQILAGVCLLPLWQTISDIFGRKWILSAGLSSYIAGCLISALAQFAHQLILGQAIRGIGMYCFYELGNAALTDVTPAAQKRQSQAVTLACVCMGASVSTILGGLLSNYAGWRCNFYFCIAIAAPCLLVMLVYFPASIPAQRSSKRNILSMDFLGASLAGSGVILVSLGLQLGGITFGWSSGNTIGFLTVGLACLFGFLVQQYFTWQPILQYSLFKDLTTASAILVSFTHGFTTLACFYYLPLYFHLALAASYIQIGLWLSATAIPSGIFAFGTAAAIKNTGHHRLIIFISTAALTMACGFFIMYASDDRDWIRLIVFQLMISIGIGSLFPALRIIMHNAVPSPLVASSAAMLEFVRGFGSVLGIVAGQVLLQNKIRDRSGELRRAHVPEHRMDNLSTDWRSFSDTMRLTPEKQGLLKEVFTESLSKVWIMCTVVAAVGFLAGFLILKTRPDQQPTMLATTDHHEMHGSNSDKDIDLLVPNSAFEA
ncbi:MFS general substrate transporter [Lecanosticta acicola]|uniref:MFS general substrate transporter n=1 Tax=Lecanosticta acicola TaxID=111012 RepID=A0AAI8YYM6_9PEZI|nr:MFS general substrate transporter [Lecanosticta acicola]